MKKLKKLELSPQNFRYDVLHLLYSGSRYVCLTDLNLELLVALCRTGVHWKPISFNDKQYFPLLQKFRPPTNLSTNYSTALNLILTSSVRVKSSIVLSYDSATQRNYKFFALNAMPRLTTASDFDDTTKLPLLQQQQLMYNA